EDDRLSGEPPGAHDTGIAKLGPRLRGTQPLGVRLHRDEVERIVRREIGKALLEAPGIEHLSDALVARDLEVVIALRADVLLLLDLRLVDETLAVEATHPQVGDVAPLAGDDRFAFLLRHIWLPFRKR